jgi:hypothetical protein
MKDPITRIHSKAIYVQLLLNGFGFNFGFRTSVAGRANAFVTTISRTECLMRFHGKSKPKTNLISFQCALDSSISFFNLSSNDCLYLKLLEFYGQLYVKF